MHLMMSSVLACYCATIMMLSIFLLSFCFSVTLDCFHIVIEARMSHVHIYWWTE